MARSKQAFRVGISGSYGGLNLGDEAILKGIVGELRRSLPVEITVFSRDAEDTRARHRVDRVVHLGGYAGVRNSVENPLVYQHANVFGTCVLLEAARRHPLDRFVLVSSSTVYGRGAVAPFVEDAPLGTPASPYGASKRAAELIASTYCELHGIPVVSLRLFSVYGPRMRPDLALAVFTERLLAGAPLGRFGTPTE